MYVKRLLSINIATLAALGTLLLGMGRQSAILPVLVLIAAVTSVWLTDLTGRFHLNRMVSNLAILTAVAFSARELLRIRGVEIVAIANLLAYAQIILLFQQKDFRVWAQLLVLSLLQVAVAASFTQGIWFGVLLVVYLFVGLSAIALLFLHHERTYYRQAGNIRASSGSSGAFFSRLEVDWARLAKIALATLVMGPMSLFLRYRESSRPDQAQDLLPALPLSSGRWPLAGQRPIFDSSTDGIGGRAGVGWEFWSRLAKMLPATLALTVVLFFSIPRIGRTNFRLPQFAHFQWGNENSIPLRTVGFSDRVELGELGSIIEDDEEVLRIEFIDPATDQLYLVQPNVYLRGAVLTRYGNKQWEYAGPGYRPTRFLSPELRKRRIRQKITIEPMDRNELFCVWPFIDPREGRRHWYDPRKERLYRPRNLQDHRFEFQLGTTAFVDGTLAELIPGDRPVQTRYLLEMPSDDLPNLVAKAGQWIDESGIPAHDWLRRARYLESQLRDSGKFTYSLMGQPRDTTIDPIEDFITTNPRGHCEYFATALTLMLRSQGIPSRMVVGFKTAEYDRLDHYFQVRQLHAHTWVEAYLDPEHLPADSPEIDNFPDWSAGGWLRLDPTPGGTVTVVAALVEGVENWFGWLSFVWESYVIEMTGQRQRDVIYDPLSASIKGLGQRLADPDWWQNLFLQIREAPSAVYALLAEVGWFSWHGSLVGMLVATFFFLAYRSLSFVIGFVLLRLVGREDVHARRERARVAFYRRLEAVLARHGLARPPAQTQREFAAEAGRKIAQATGQAHLAELPAQVADAFYYVRFGGEALDNHRVQAVELALSQLELVTDRKQ